MSIDVRFLLPVLALADRRAAVWCACQCVRTVLHLLPDGEERPGVAIETALAWVRGEATEEACARAAAVAADASSAYHNHVGILHFASTLEADEVNDELAARLAAMPRDRDVLFASCGVSSAAASAAGLAASADVLASSIESAARGAARALAHADVPALQAAVDQSTAGHLARLGSLVRDLPWPSTVTTPEQLKTTLPAVRAVWGSSWLREITDSLTLEDLARAFVRAEGMGLDWRDPAQRALAERITGEAEVARLLGAAGFDASRLSFTAWGQQTAREVVRLCTRDLFRRLAAADHRAATWCVAQCVRTVLPLVPAPEERLRRHVETIEAWAEGRATEQACRQSAGAVRDVRCTHRVFAAAYSAAASVYIVRGAPRDDGIFAVESAAWAMAASHEEPERQKVEDRHLAYLLDLVSALRWPLAQPTHDQLRAAPHALQVAWDALAGRAREDQAIPELIEAHDRAGRLALDWSDPVQRAVAERTTDEARVARLLAAEGT